MNDIEEFQIANKKALDAAYTYVRRARKGLPSDRWADGIKGARLVADGIAAQFRLLVLYEATTRAVWSDLREFQIRAQEGMGIIEKE